MSIKTWKHTSKTWRFKVFAVFSLHTKDRIRRDIRSIRRLWCHLDFFGRVFRSEIQWGPLTKPGSDSGSDRISDRIGLRIGSDRIGLVFSLLVQDYYSWENAVLTITQVDRIFFFEPPVSLISKIVSHVTPTSLKIHHQLENHHFRDFRNRLLWKEAFNLGSVKKKTNTVESRDGKKQNQSNERHLNLSPPSSIREVLHDQVLLWNCNRMNSCNRKFPSAV